jgi:hypothetical protein
MLMVAMSTFPLEKERCAVGSSKKGENSLIRVRFLSGSTLL